MASISYVLVTGATGFIGAHIVDRLLEKGLKVRGTTRSPEKGQLMKDARPQYASQLDFVQIEDFTAKADFDHAVQGVDGVIHTASPLTYSTTDNEKELILPAINGVKAILSAAAKTGTLQRVVLTSSFASVLDAGREAGPDFTYTGEHWNPLSYEESIAPGTSAVIAYRGSKKFAELEAWRFVEREKPSFDLVAFCPPMTFGPIAHPVKAAEQLNESNAKLWEIAVGKPLPEARVPVWIDVRDLAQAHAEALLSPKAGGKRYVPASPEKFSYQLAAAIMRKHFPAARAVVVAIDEAEAPTGYGLDGASVSADLGVEYHSFERCVVDLFRGLEGLGMRAWE